MQPNKEERKKKKKKSSSSFTDVFRGALYSSREWVRGSRVQNQWVSQLRDGSHMRFAGDARQHAPDSYAE